MADLPREHAMPGLATGADAGRWKVAAGHEEAESDLRALRLAWGV